MMGPTVLSSTGGNDGAGCGGGVVPGVKGVTWTKMVKVLL